MKNFKCFTVVLFFLFSCSFTFADENSTPEEKCFAFLKESPDIGELQTGLMECKKVVSPKFYAIIERDAVKYAEGVIFETRVKMINQVTEKAQQGAKAE